MSNNLSHIDAKGKAQMVDVGQKSTNHRLAIAQGKVLMGDTAWQALMKAEVIKGDVLGTARIAGIMAAKNTAQMIPLCHPLGLDQVTVEFDTSTQGELIVQATAKVAGKTGVEMEALSAVSVAALTVYDMLKAIEKGIRITDVRLLHKSGGKSGDWNHDD